MPFVRGKSGNPGGRPAIAKTCREAGFEPDELRAEVLQQLVSGMRDLDPKDPDEAASWRFCLQTLDHRLNGKPVQQIETSEPESMTPEEINQVIDRAVRERVAAMSPEERMKLLADPAPTHTIQ